MRMGSGYVCGTAMAKSIFSLATGAMLFIPMRFDDPPIQLTFRGHTSLNGNPTALSDFLNVWGLSCPRAYDEPAPLNRQHNRAGDWSIYECETSRSHVHPERAFGGERVRYRHDQLSLGTHG